MARTPLLSQRLSARPLGDAAAGSGLVSVQEVLGPLGMGSHDRLGLPMATACPWEPLGPRERVYLITDDHLAMRQLLRQGCAQLSTEYREGASHRAHALLWATPQGVQATQWIALIPDYNASTSEGGLSPEAIQRATAEHQHNRLVAAAGGEVLPRYAGMAIVVAGGSAPHSAPVSVRIAHVWQRMDATLQDLVDRGGLIAKARIGAAELGLEELRWLMLQCGRLYQRLHQLGMVYTDPKPANLALRLTPALRPQVDGPAVAGDAPLSQHPVAWHPIASRPLVRTGHAHLPPLGHLCFIDAESLEMPGYCDDAARAAVTAMTPSWIAPQVLSALGTERELKRLQSSEASDVFHLAAISFALITGQPPQALLMDARCADPALGDEFGDATSTRRCAQAAIEVRIQRDFSADARRLAQLADCHAIPVALMRQVMAGLTGELSTLAQWISHLLTASWNDARA